MLLLSGTPLISHCWQASERSERDTIRGVQIRAGAVYVYNICMETCAIIVAHATHT